MTAIGIQTFWDGKRFVFFWDYDSEEDFYYHWSSAYTMGM